MFPIPLFKTHQEARVPGPNPANEKKLVSLVPDLQWTPTQTHPARRTITKPRDARRTRLRALLQTDAAGWRRDIGCRGSRGESHERRGEGLGFLCGVVLCNHYWLDSKPYYQCGEGEESHVGTGLSEFARTTETEQASGLDSRSLRLHYWLSKELLCVRGTCMHCNLSS